MSSPKSDRRSGSGRKRSIEERLNGRHDTEPALACTVVRPIPPPHGHWFSNQAIRELESKATAVGDALEAMAVMPLDHWSRFSRDELIGLTRKAERIHATASSLLAAITAAARHGVAERRAADDPRTWLSGRLDGRTPRRRD